MRCQELLVLRVPLFPESEMSLGRWMRDPSSAIWTVFSVKYAFQFGRLTTSIKRENRRPIRYMGIVESQISTEQITAVPDLTVTSGIMQCQRVAPYSSTAIHQLKKVLIFRNPKIPLPLHGVFEKLRGFGMKWRI